MAVDKKSFILYSDLIHTVNKMPSDKAGDLFKHILSYVNDEEPQTDDLIIQLTFEPIKQQLKRDLKKYEGIKNKRSEAGKESARLRALKKEQQKQQKSTSVESVEQTSTNPTVNDNGNVNDNDNGNVIKKKDIFIFKNALIDAGAKEYLVSDWLKVRKTKKATNTKTAFNGFLKQIEKTSKNINEILEICINNSWAGFKSEWLENQEAKPNKKTANGLTKNSNGTYNVI